ncbi:PEPxxWA-CTERM sorting domain-containing protein [Sandarakinorhabdus sp.]|uniref:PEPxxWA-CTERM sorting domain-containing protein n=1 Tax=Sandarakinorhabdus sp. TaxID=1916663 RepID=UPI00286E5DF8|nr:PEPxxWA-CTERM sorting domain-containing protein [Sandarakinorhabdus sp.]
MRLNVLFLSAAVALAASPGAAQVLFSQNFNSLPQGIPAAGVPGFTTTGTVDIVTNGNFGITCAGNTGACADLAGTPGPGMLTSTGINFLAGRNITISFDLSGNQRDLARDTFDFKVLFAAPPVGFGGALAGPAPFTIGGFQTAVSGGTYSEVVAGDRSFLTYSGFLNLAGPGTLFLQFAGRSGDNVNIGPILDNVLVTQGAVPEPASWAMLIAGFGLVGAASRRRRRLAVA